MQKNTNKCRGPQELITSYDKYFDCFVVLSVVELWPQGSALTMQRRRYNVLGFWCRRLIGFGVNNSNKCCQTVLLNYR